MKLTEDAKKQIERDYPSNFDAIIRYVEESVSIQKGQSTYIQYFNAKGFVLQDYDFEAHANPLTIHDIEKRIDTLTGQLEALETARCLALGDMSLFRTFNASVNGDDVKEVIPEFVGGIAMYPDTLKPFTRFPDYINGVRVSLADNIQSRIT